MDELHARVANGGIDGFNLMRTVTSESAPAMPLPSGTRWRSS